MRVTQIKIAGPGGHVTIERASGGPGETFIRIRSDASGGDERQPWVMVIPATAKRENLFNIAWTIQRRTDGYVGTNSMICQYLYELERFTD